MTRILENDPLLKKDEFGYIFENPIHVWLHSTQLKEIGSHSGDITIKNWCEENLLGSYIISSFFITFADEADAVLFKLRWC